MNLTLFHYWRSTSSWRVRWALAYKKIPCQFQHVDLLQGEQTSPENLLRNPMGQVPTLDVEGRLLTESIAILEWIEETFTFPSLLPRSAWDRAQVRRLAEMINAGTQPVQNLLVRKKHSTEKTEQDQWARFWIQRGLKAYENAVRETAGTFSFGSQLSFADLTLIPQCYNALRVGLTLDAYPVVNRIYQNALLTESYQESEPEKFKP